jgi:putative flippase GtrA
LFERLASHTLVRFVFVGGLNTLFGYLIFALYTYFIGNAYVALALSTVTSVLFNFKTYGVLVFKSHNNALIYRFVGAYLFLIGLQLILLKWLTTLGVTNQYIAVGILVPPMAACSFVLLRKFVFHQSFVPGNPAVNEKPDAPNGERL